ncbi:MAG TPA: DEAD/DEAH box helicase family protein [Ktedonobacteraceae bacterium]|nr:DEAD/DEAH box helicase family protein [Ktedonobacteraceae bacterium]
MSKRAYFYGGTLVLEGFTADEQSLPEAFLWSHGKWRTEGYHYGNLLPWLRQNTITDTIPRWETLNYTLYDRRQPHDYQTEALVAWQKAGWHGSIVLPTGAGKSYVAIRAIQKINRSAVVVAPTIDLLHQWYRLLSHAFGAEIGVYYGAEKIVHPLTVTTYSSFGNLMAEYGNTYKLLILDEAHRASSPAFGEGAMMSTAVARLGLTATYPSEAEQQGAGRWRIEELVGGPIVYALNVDDLAGEQLATYRTQRIRVDLTEAERETYDREFAQYMGFVHRHNLLRHFGPNWLSELRRQSARSRDARAALLARQRVSKLLAGCQGKMQAVNDLLYEHMEDQIVIFTESNTVAYNIAQRYFLPVITHLSTALERKEILDGFHQGRYKAVVTSRVLDEGVDLPSAKIAIILGGTAGARQYIQRRGRVLRKVENKEAVLYEVFARGTSEEGKVQRRRAAVQRQGKEIRVADL